MVAVHVTPCPTQIGASSTASEAENVGGHEGLNYLTRGKENYIKGPRNIYKKLKSIIRSFPSVTLDFNYVY